MPNPTPNPNPNPSPKPNPGKYSWRIMREEYRQWTSVLCDDMHDVDFQFNSLQHSSSYDATS